MRLQSGDEIELTDGKGSLCIATITTIDQKALHFRIKEEKKILRRGFSIHLAIAPTKNLDRMEWLIEKCVELGIEKISFLLCKTSERKFIQLDRIEKIAISALKQSRQAWLPSIAGMTPLPELVAEASENQKFIACVDHDNPVHLARTAAPSGDYIVLIGPEGDFKSDEIILALSSGFRKVSLGPNRLRTETAGLVACGILNQINAE